MRTGFTLSSALSVAALLAVAVPSNGLPTKRLASPPADLLSGKLALPSPEAAGVSSHSALLPVRFEDKAGARRFEVSFPVDASERFSVMLLAPQGGWQAAVQSPLARQASKMAHAGATVSEGELAIGEQKVAGEVYTFDHPANGTWRITIATDRPAAKASEAPDGYLLLSVDSPVRLYAHLASYDLVAGRTVGLVAYAYDADQEGKGGKAPRPLAGALAQAVMRLTTPSGKVVSVPMFDDGRHQDGRAGDGVFGGLYANAAPGTYTAQVEAAGVSPEGKAFVRTSQHLFPVVESALALARGAAARPEGHDLRFDLAVSRLSRHEAVEAGAEVWGTRDGRKVPVAWIGGMIEPQGEAGAYTLPLVLDGRWLELAQATAPFELRRVTVKDRDAHVPIATFGRLAVETQGLPEPRAEKATAITEEMLTGPRPSEREMALANLAGDGAKAYIGGKKLVLVHGYCSGSVWNAGSFTNSAVFQDLNQNRTHDQFAQRIATFGGQWDSFGVVAHSQGGAASLHLYTYYWSGLDYATGNRLIQSVGTPYQGTSLAGNLALLGQIFGVGCGSNFDLTYDGAALWLAGIPTWARAKVNYFTTSFTDVWYRYDYCQAASDVVLSDPDDGVIEQSRGQLSGAVNRGHKTGWCHTSGMRDPAQTSDGARNSDMSANAAR